MQATFFETAASICGTAYGQPATAARLLHHALARLDASSHQTLPPTSLAARLHPRRFNYLCAAADWQAAHAAVLSEPPSAAQLERTRVLVQRAAAAREYRALAAWTWPGVVLLDGGEPVSYTHLTLPTTPYV